MIRNPKWCSKELTKRNVFNRQKFNNSNSPTIDESLPNLGDDPTASEGINSDEVVRPQGRKSCKEKKRKLNEENGVMNALNKLQCTLEKQVNVNLVDLDMKREKDRKEFELREQVMKKEIELKEKAQKLRERAQRRQEQERIMNQDLTKLSPNVRASYEIFQGQILKEWESEGLFGNNMQL
ncbi:NAM-associated domain-containing protein [Abeliophyllum distichum]|uniref:NAM-associated domain-containing protein n=1 Tax=Abeliophyllum distichum TaxID=126358 RepID=A0ABD1SSC9_9LAMI